MANTQMINTNNNEEEDCELLRMQALQTLKNVKKESFSTQNNIYNRPMPYVQQQPRSMFGPVPMSNYGPQNHSIGYPPINAHHPHINPHVNPHFMSQSVCPMMSHQDDIYPPIASGRLSPRSAAFVAQNTEALTRRKNSSRSPPYRHYSSKSRSRSPNKRYSRSRSRSLPRYKARRSPIQNGSSQGRKRTHSRSKSPVVPYSNKFNRTSQNDEKRQRTSDSPKRVVKNGRSQPNQQNRFNNNYNNKQRYNRYDRQGNDGDKKSASDKKDVGDEKIAISSPKEEPVKVCEANANSGDSSTNIETSEVDDKKKQYNAQDKAAEPNLADKEKRVKTQEELEDELLASSDESDAEKGITIVIQEEELDFLQDESEGESENEGRFKSKASSSSNNKETAGKSTNSYYSQNNSRGPSPSGYRRERRDRADNRPKNDYSKRNRNDDDYRSQGRQNFKNSTGGEKSVYKSPAKEVTEKDRQEKIQYDSKNNKPFVAVVKGNKKSEPKKVETKKIEPKFKPTFKNVESPVLKRNAADHAKTVESSKAKDPVKVSKDRVVLNRPKVVASKIEDSAPAAKSSSPPIVKSTVVIKTSESSQPKKRILDRLGEFVGKKKFRDDKEKRSDKDNFKSSWPKEQV